MRSYLRIVLCGVLLGALALGVVAQPLSAGEEPLRSAEPSLARMVKLLTERYPGFADLPEGEQLLLADLYEEAFAPEGTRLKLLGLNLDVVEVLIGKRIAKRTAIANRAAKLPARATGAQDEPRPDAPRPALSEEQLQAVIGEMNYRYMFFQRLDDRQQRRFARLHAEAMQSGPGEAQLQAVIGELKVQYGFFGVLDNGEQRLLAALHAEALRSGPEHVARVAVIIEGRIRRRMHPELYDIDARDRFLTSLLDADRIALIQMLGASHDPRYVPLLDAEALTDSSREIRIEAARALGSIDHRMAIMALRNRLLIEDAHVVKEAIEAGLIAISARMDALEKMAKLGQKPKPVASEGIIKKLQGAGPDTAAGDKP